AGCVVVREAVFRFKQAGCRHLWVFLLAAGEAFVDERSEEGRLNARSFIDFGASLNPPPNFGASPRVAVAAERRKLAMDTPGTSVGYCIARNRPARARSSTSRSRRFTPSSSTSPSVTS